MCKPSEFLTCKHILIVVVFLGFMLHHMLRINMSVAIIDMIVSNGSNMTEVQRFDWNEEQKNDILGCFFWGYIVASLASGHLSEVYGTRAVLGSGLVLATICTLLTPLVTSYLSYTYLIVLRIGVGIGLGVQFSSIMPLATKWIPPTDMSKFLSTMLASQLGTAATLIFCGYLIKAFGWPSVFYVTGAIGATWCLPWFYCVYDSPRQHPRISKEELQYLQQRVKFQTSAVPSRKPWAAILTSRPVWAIVIAFTCVLFNVHSAINYTSLYMNQVLKFNIKANGLISSLPFIATYLSSVLSSFLADKWNKTGYLSVYAIRQIFTVGAFWVSVFSLIVQSIWGYNYIVSVVTFIIWQSSTGCHIAGCIPNAVDVTPNYSGTILGLGTSLGSIMGYMSTKIVATFIKNEQNFNQWRVFFWAAIAVNVVGAGFYYIFASTEVQEWNNAPLCLEKQENCDDAMELCEINGK
ncbi:sialin-like [Zophobas morio]|uniref:sialin-like n=1 Tax=Zophobas morio TaxID=2755281 RepID=UPI003082AF5E